MFSADDVFAAALSHVEFCLDRARDSSSKEAVALWKERATGAADVWQIPHLGQRAAKEGAQFQELLREFDLLLAD